LSPATLLVVSRVRHFTSPLQPGSRPISSRHRPHLMQTPCRKSKQSCLVFSHSQSMVLIHLELGHLVCVAQFFPLQFPAQGESPPVTRERISWSCCSFIYARWFCTFRRPLFRQQLPPLSWIPAPPGLVCFPFGVASRSCVPSFREFSTHFIFTAAPFFPLHFQTAAGLFVFSESCFRGTLGWCQVRRSTYSPISPDFSPPPPQGFGCWAYLTIFVIGQSNLKLRLHGSYLVPPSL